MAFDIKKTSLGEKLMLISVLVAVVSMFCPFLDAGVIQRNGLAEMAFIPLLCWIYPAYAIFIGKRAKFLVTFICGLIPAGCCIYFLKFRVPNLPIVKEKMASATDILGAGFWMFLGATAVLLVGAIMNINFKKLVVKKPAVKKRTPEQTEKLGKKIIIVSAILAVLLVVSRVILRGLALPSFGSMVMLVMPLLGWVYPVTMIAKKKEANFWVSLACCLFPGWMVARPLQRFIFILINGDIIKEITISIMYCTSAILLILLVVGIIMSRPAKDHGDAAAADETKGQ